MNSSLQNSNRERIGILGGSFNPVHLGHLLLAQTAIEQLELNRVLFMPCAIQPHKSSGMLAQGDLRKRMLESAIQDHPAFELLDIELQRGGVSYSVDSLRTLSRLYPNAQLFFLIGADTLIDLHLWKDIDAIFGLCTLAVFARPGYDLDILDPEQLCLSAAKVERIRNHVIRVRQVDISASDIRHRVAEGLNIRYLVPQSVEMIIQEHHLYQRIS